MVAQQPNGSVAHLGCSSALRVNLWVGVRTEFLTEVFTLCNTRCTQQAGRGDTWKAAGFFSPRWAESTLYQLRWEHVTAVSGHRSLCEKQHVTQSGRPDVTLHTDYISVAWITLRAFRLTKKQHQMAFLSWLGGKEEEIKMSWYLTTDRKIQLLPSSGFITLRHSIQSSVAPPPPPPSSPWFTRKRSFWITARFPDTLYMPSVSSPATNHIEATKCGDLHRRDTVSANNLRKGWLQFDSSKCFYRSWGVVCLSKPLCVMLKLCAPR